MRRRSAVLAAIAAASITGGCGPSWPKRAPARADPAFMARHRAVTTVDILPIDLEAWTQPGVRQSADQLRAGAEDGILGAASVALLARGYLVGNALGWDGTYVLPDGRDGVALSPEAVLATVDSLASYGLAAQDSPGLPVPFLPARLGTTGSDATLYIGGWTFEGRSSSTGGKIAKGVLIAVAIVGVVIVLAALAKGKGGDGLGKLGGRAAGGAVRTAASMGRVAARAALRVGNLSVQLARGAARHADDVLDVTGQVLDALGRTGTHLSIGRGAERPTWSERPGVPRRGHSRTYLELTLVDNHTGLVLWHAHQQFPTHAARRESARRILDLAMASLPPAGTAP